MYKVYLPTELTPYFTHTHTHGYTNMKVATQVTTGDVLKLLGYDLGRVDGRSMYSQTKHFLFGKEVVYESKENHSRRSPL